MMEGFWRMKAGLAFLLALVFLVLFGLGIMAGVSYITGTTSSAASTGPGVGYSIIGLCTAAGLVPALFFLFIGLGAKKREEEIVAIASYLISYRRVKLAVVAKKLGRTEFETEKILVQCVDKKLIDGFFDRTTEEFVVRSAVSQELAVYRCASCGATVSKKYLAGETAKCDFCGGLMESAKQELLGASTGAVTVYPCYRCGQALEFVVIYQKWFCRTCQAYV